MRYCRDAVLVRSLGSRLDSTYRGRPDHANLAHLGFLEACSKLHKTPPPPGFEEEEPKN